MRDKTVTSRAVTHLQRKQVLGHAVMQQRVCRGAEAPIRSILSPAGALPSVSPHCSTTPSMAPKQPKALRVHIVTFNMNFKAPADVPDELLGRAGCPDGLKKYDIVVVGTQESGPLQVTS